MPTTVIDLRGRDRAGVLADPAFVYVGRAVPRRGWKASPWGNPFPEGRAVVVEGVLHPAADAAACVARYAAWMARHPERMARIPELRGRVLGCWCCDWDGAGDPIRPCHAVWLARAADAL
jgi:Domain of unknown function (DUF4326)